MLVTKSGRTKLQIVTREEYNVRSKEETRKREIVVEPTEFISGSSVVTY